MQNYEDKLIETLFYKPSLIEQLIIPDECFKSKDNLELLIEMKKQYELDKTFDISSFSMRLQRENKTNLVTKITYIIETGSNIDIVNFEYYQEELFKTYKNNLLIENTKQFFNKKIDMDTYVSNIHKIEEKTIITPDGKKSYKEIMDMLENNSKSIKFRYPKLCHALKLSEHDFTIISARPSVGKTGFMLNLLESISNKYKVVLFNMEMSEEQVYKRLLGIMTGIPIKELRDAKNRQRVSEYAKQLAERNIKIYTGSQTLQSIRRKIIDECKDEHTVIFIDYIGLMNNNDKYNSLYEMITTNTKSLRNISMSYNCTIIALAQLNRTTEKRDNGPQLSDLKESGELEQSAVSVLFLFGDEKENGNIEQRITIRIAKNRNGEKGDKDFMYFKDTQQFEEILE